MDKNATMLLDDRAVEQKHLTETIDFVQTLIDENKQKYETVSHNVDLLNDYIKANPNLDAKEIAVVLQQSSDEFEKSYDIIKNKEILERTQKSPYFSKVSFKEDETGRVEDYYFGIKSIWDKSKIYVVDWRTPSGTLYYDGKVGRAEYEAPAGKITGEILSKRQFKIIDGKMEYFFDSTVKIDDEILQEALSKNSSNTMTNIVQTIQKEQNEIIRDKLERNIVLNGVAGSGKTSIGMHRIAYLLYAYKKSLNKDNILIISPNSLFTKYIGSVLPELGEDNVKTNDMNTIMMYHLPTLSHILSRNELVEDVLSGNTERLLEAERKYAYSNYENLCKFLSEKNNPTKLTKLTLSKNKIDYDIIKKFYYKEGDYNLYRSCEITASRLVGQLAYEKTFKQQEVLKKQLTMQMVNTLVGKNLNDIVVEYFNKQGFYNKDVNNKNIRSEDLSTFAFLNCFCYGLKRDFTFKQIFIDELQDYDNTMLMLLKEIYPETYFTMVGDYNQNLLFRQTNKQSAMSFNKSKYYSLINSYRSTSNITDFSADILGTKFNSTFVRKGKNPKLVKCENFEDKVNKIKIEIENLINNGYEKIAIVCKNNEECEKYKDKFNGFECILRETQDIINVSKVIVSVLFSKGLEFDAVIIPDADDVSYSKETDRQVLYVASTRALHSLNLFYIDKPSRFIVKNQNVDFVN